jgi:hypothetical protein
MNKCMEELKLLVAARADEESSFAVCLSSRKNMCINEAAKASKEGVDVGLLLIFFATCVLIVMI